MTDGGCPLGFPFIQPQGTLKKQTPGASLDEDVCRAAPAKPGDGVLVEAEEETDPEACRESAGVAVSIRLS